MRFVEFKMEDGLEEGSRGLRKSEEGGLFGKSDLIEITS
jgi:hypothetical protein